MQSIQDLLENLTLNDYTVGCAYWVDVTHINTPHSFYVRSTVCRIHMPVVESYEELVDASQLSIQSMVVFKSETINSHVRGQISFIADDKEETLYDIFAPDYGFLEKSVPLKRIKTACFAYVPPLATHCRLAECKPITTSWTKKSIIAMRTYVGNERAKMVIREKKPSEMVVELINTCPDDIATLMALTGYSVLGCGSNVVNRLTTLQSEQHYFKFKELKVGEVFHVRTQSGNTLDCFYVTLMDDYKHYLNERQNFTYFSKKQKPLCPEDLKKDKAVGVYIDSTCKYERAIIKEITVPDKKAVVQLVDWGKKVEVDISRIKTMSEKFFHYSAAAVFCSVEDTQLWDNNLHKYLYLGCEFMITIKNAGDKFISPYVVHISPKS